MPTPDFKKWSVNRQEEILCFSEYVLQLRSWVALGSDVFALVRAYIEGVGADGVYQIHRGTSGFEALRILGKEFSLRSRAEASFFRGGAQEVVSR